MAFLKDAITRTVPLSLFPPFLMPHSLAYKQARETIRSNSMPTMALAAGASGLWQLAFPASAITIEHVVDVGSKLHRTFETNGLLRLAAGAVDLAGYAATIALAPHMPQLPFHLPFVDQHLSDVVMPLIEAKLVVNAVTNLGGGLVEVDMKRRYDKDHPSHGW